MYLIATLLIDFLGAALLAAAVAAGVFGYQVYDKTPPELKDKSAVETILAQPQLQAYLVACVVASLLFVVCMVAHAVIDTARNTRKILRQLEASQNQKT